MLLIIMAGLSRAKKKIKDIFNINNRRGVNIKISKCIVWKS